MPAASADRKPRTQAQAEASRTNGARGNGPRTPEGKAASSLNALKHGLTATTDALLPTEDEAAFADHCAAVEAEYAPQGPTERALVTQLALVFWRMIRVEAVEAEVLIAREPRPDGHFIGGYGPLSPFLWDARRLDAVTRYRGQLERGQFRLLKELKERRAARAADAAPAPVRNEPEPAPPAVDGPDARPAPAAARNEPEPAAFALASRPRATAAAPANDPFVAALGRAFRGGGG